MVFPYNRKQIHTFFYILSLMGLAVSISTAVFVMSVSTIVLFLNWLIEGDFKAKFERIKENKAVWAVLGIFVLHIIWLPLSHDYAYGIDDLRKKLPLLIITLVLGSSSIINKKQMLAVLGVYVLTVFINSLIGFYNRLTHPLDDYRSAVNYISQIRFSLNVCLAFFFLLFFIYRKIKAKQYAFLGLLGINAWFIFFLIICQSLTGLFILLVCGSGIGIYCFVKSLNKWMKSGIALLILCLLGGIIGYIYKQYNHYFTPSSYNQKPLASHTRAGNLYTHDTLSLIIENGNYIGLYICEKEMQPEWNMRSTYDYEGLDLKSQQLKQTLIRYLNSKGLRKDSEGISKLSNWDIKNIENGITNISYTQKYSLQYRLYQTFFELNLYNQTGICKGSSLTQRFELWKNAIYIIKQHWCFGVGTGDVAQEVKQALTERNSDLQNTSMRTHNQFLTFLLTFGLVGFLIFIFCLFYPGFKTKAFCNNYMYILFFIIICLSMLTEDTFETQAGITFFAFFNALLLFQANSSNSFFFKNRVTLPSIS